MFIHKTLFSKSGGRHPSDPYRFLSLLLILGLLSACSRQFSVTINDRSIYDPRVPTNTILVSDADLQGCVNLAVRQQGIEQAEDLTVLSCANASVRELDGLEQFTQLRFLDLANNNITSLQPLVPLSSLSGVSVPDNPLTDISALLAMTGLTVANLRGNNQIPCAQLDRLETRLGANLTRPESCAN